MTVYGETPNIDQQVIRLPRPQLWVNHRRRINMDTHEDPPVGIVHLTDRYALPSTSRSTPVFNPNFITPTLNRLTSANLAAFDDKHSDHHQQLSRPSTRLPANHTAVKPLPRIDYTAITPPANTNAPTADYRLTMETIAQLSCSTIDMPDDEHGLPIPNHASAPAAGDSADSSAFDTNSMASSTHFTLVNGFGAMKYKKPDTNRRYCCCSPIAALIITMTVLLAVIVFCMIFFAEYPHMTSIVE